MQEPDQHLIVHFSNAFLITGILLFVLRPGAPVSAQGGCIESASISSTPVQCNTFRNGTISIDTVIGGTAPYFYSIDGETFSTRPFFDLLWPEQYTVTVRDSTGCVFSESITVEEPPVLEVHLNTNKLRVALGEPFDLNATYTPSNAVISTVRWRPPEYFEDGIKFVQTVNGIQNTTTFAIEIVNEDGCTARDQVTVEVKLPNVYVPNVISIGSNQDAYFTVFSDEYVRSVKSLRVYSRNGSLVFQRDNFEPNDPLQGWNGKHRDRKVQPGVFTWVSEVELLNGSTHLLYGTVTVLR